jgi:hypothetical protein
MNKRNTIAVLILLTAILLRIADNTRAQVPYDSSFRAEARASREHVVLYADRGMYAVNERIRFRWFYRCGGSAAGGTWSTVMYVELVSPSGTAVVRGKYPNGPVGGSGFLEIPPGVLTGRYYLRAYTRWMRNFDSGDYCYIPLNVINPYIREVRQENGGTSPTLVSGGMGSTGISCRTDKPAYAPGEEVLLELSAGKAGTLVDGDYCVSVVPSGLADRNSCSADSKRAKVPDHFIFNFLPDIRGVSLSGSVIRTDDQRPAAKARVYLAMLGDRTDLQTVLTDEEGRFILSLPDAAGMKEIYVSPAPAEGASREIRIDQDFAAEPVPFSSGPFRLSEEQRKAATRMARNIQLEMAFRGSDGMPEAVSGADTAAGNLTRKGPGLPFYGVPDQVVNLKDFISLPNMTEIFENLVTNVYVHYRKGKPHLQMLSPNSNISLYPPLLLIDDIPVLDEKSFLSVAPSRIRRIEVIDDLYVKGDRIFGGVISLRSIKGDMAAVDLPEESYFFDYQTFYTGSPGTAGGTDYGENPSGMGTGNGGTEPAGSSRIPDTRNTLLWIDRLRFSRDNTRSLRFRAAPAEGEYLVLIRGVDSEGKPVVEETIFRVRR